MIRIATPTDADILIKIRTELLMEAKKDITDYDWASYARVLKKYYEEGLLDGNVVVFLAEEDGKVVGMCGLCTYRICPSLFNLEGRMTLMTDMYTKPEWRNKSIGNDLLNATMNHAKSMGSRSVHLKATDMGRKLYEKYGFKDQSGEMAFWF